jgi:hypothetical protein
MLTGATQGSVVAFAETTAGDLATVTVSGSVVHLAAGPDLTIDTATHPTSVTEVDLGLTAPNTNLNIIDHGGAANTIVTINGSASTGGITTDVGSFFPAALAGSGVSAEDLSALTTVTLGSGNNTLADDTVTKLGSAVTYTFGDGNNTFLMGLDGNAHNVATTTTFGAGHNSYITTTAIDDINVAPTSSNYTQGFATITNFSTTLDVLNIASAGAAGTFVTLTNPQQAAITAAPTLLAALNLAAVDVNTHTRGDTVAFQYGHDTYIYENGGLSATLLAAGDGVIKLTGVTETALNGTNFVHA